MSAIMNKVFVSSYGIKKLSIIKTIEKFSKNNINNIELSSNKYINKKEIKKILLFKKIKFKLHNYFPPPKIPFVINLASKDPNIIKKSINNIKKSIILSKKLKSSFFSFHAGFRIDPAVSDLGNSLFGKICDKKTALQIFKKNILLIHRFSKIHKIKLLIENNVITKKNFLNYKDNPMLLTSPNDIRRFFKSLPKDIGLLLDVAHLKVSSETEGFSLKKAFEILNPIVKGYHLSDNNGLIDNNQKFKKNSFFFKFLRKDLNYYVIEVYKTTAKELFIQKKIIENFIK